MTRSLDRRPVVTEDLTRLRWPIEPAITADAASVAFVVSGPDARLDRLTYELYVHSRTSGLTTRVGSETTCRRPRFCPNDERMAFLVDSGAGPRLSVAGAGGEHPTVVGHSSTDDFDWSPAGDRLASVHGTSVSIVTLDGVEERLDVAASLATIRAVRWSPDGSQLALVSDDRADVAESVLWVHDVNNASTRLAHRWRGPMNACEWAPDGSTIAIVGHPNGSAGWHNNEIWLVPSTSPGQAVSLHPGFDRSIGQVVRGDDERGIGGTTLCWSADGTSLDALVAFGGRSALVRFGIDGRHREIVAGERAVLAFAGPTATGELVVSWSDPDNPGELALIADGVELPITSLNADWLAEVRLARTTALQATSSAESSAGFAVSVDGWLSEPVEGAASPGNARLAPLVVQVHGGPHYPVGSRFSFDAHRLAGLGLCLLRSNPRGSQGYGAAFARETTADWGGAALCDLLALSDAAALHSGVDRDRVAIIGESYGGFMVNCAISKTDRFVAAVAENGIADVLRLAQGPRGPTFWQLEFEADPSKAPDRFVAASPLESVESITTPLLLVHAEDDDNCPIEQSEVLYAALESRDRPVEFVRIPGEGHFINVFGRPSRRALRTRAIDAFLERLLLGVGSSPKGSANEGH